MKILRLFALVAALVVLTVLPAAADSLGTGEPTPEPTTAPGGETEEPTEEPTTAPGGETEEPVVDETEPTRDADDDDDDAAGELADTGIDASTLAFIAGGLLLAGGAAVAVSRTSGRKDA